MFRRNRSGFTLVELLVVIAIIGMLMGLVVPAVNSAREKARTGICMSNMRQVGLAVQQYEQRSTSAPYPGYLNFMRLSDGTNYRALGAPYPSDVIGQEVGVSWIIELFPYLDQATLYNAFRAGTGGSNSGGGAGGGATGGGTGGGGGTAQQVTYANYIETLVCPSDPPSDFKTAPVSFVANTGMQDSTRPGYRDFKENGIFHDHYSDNPSSPAGRANSDRSTQRTEQVLSTHIKDGLQYTLLISENVDADSYLTTERNSTTQPRAEPYLGFTWVRPQSVDASDPNLPFAVKPNTFNFINEKRGECTQRPPVTEPSGSASGGGTAGGGGGGGTAGGGTGGATTRQTTPGGGGGTTGGGGGSSSGADSPYNWARPSSVHPNGVNVVFCDGHAIFLSDKIDYYVYTLLMAPYDRGVKDPQTGQLMTGVSGYGDPASSPKAPPFNEEWLKR